MLTTNSFQWLWELSPFVPHCPYAPTDHVTLIWTISLSHRYVVEIVIWMDYERSSFSFQLQICRTLGSSHTSQFTWQHQINLQLHLTLAVYFSVLNPRSQHIKRHPSIPIDVALHIRPAVPDNRNTINNFIYDVNIFQYYVELFLNGICFRCRRSNFF